MTSLEKGDFSNRPNTLLKAVGLAVNILGWYALIGGLISFAGWPTGIARLRDWFDSGISIKVNTALACFASGAGLILLRRFPVLTRVLGTFAAVIGGLTVLEHLGDWDFGIDTLLYDERPGAYATASPGRMGPPASTSFLLIGIALVLLTMSGKRRSIAVGFAIASIAISLLSLTGYFYGAVPMYSIPRLTGIAVQTATMIFALGVGLVLAAPERYPVRAMLEESAAGVLARRALPVVIFLPILLGWLRISGQNAGLYDSAFGTALRTVIEVILLAALLCWAVAMVRVSEKGRRESDRRMTETLRAKERQLQHIADNAAVMVAQCNRDCIYTFANRTYAEYLNRPVEEIIGKPVRDVIGYDAFEAIRPYVDRVLNGERVDYEAQIPYVGKGSRWMRVVYVPDCDRRGRVTGWIAAISDVTDRKQAEVELKDADRRKDEFLATLAHELRNPLAPVRNAVQILQLNGSAEPDMRWARDVIDRQVQQMTRLIDDLLDVSRISLGKIELKRQRVDLAEIVQGAVETSRMHVDEFGHSLEIDLPKEPIYLDADLVRMAQVLSNLLNNAAKYTERGGKIVLSAQRQGSDVIISVKDTGIGIPADKLRSVFDMFAQVRSAFDRSQGGLGIGLSLVKNLVEMHGGSVEAKSDGPGKGSEFLVRLPIVVEAKQVPAVAGEVDNGNCGASFRILVVDDNRDSADTSAMMLRVLGNEVWTAYDGEEGVQKACEHRPDVILLDIGMPKLNGYEACRRIRQEPWGQQVVLVAITGWGQDDDLRRSEEAGFNHHMVKPADPRALMKYLAELQATKA